VQMLWHVHHQLALRRPKLGELVAFRNVIDDFPRDTSTDEPAIEALIAAKGYEMAYAPKAIVYNRGPEGAHEFLIQRRRIFAGQVRIALRYKYFTSSLRMRHVPISFSISDTFTIAAALLFGPAAGTVVVVIDALVMSLRIARGGASGMTVRVVFNAASTALAMWLAATARTRALRVAGGLSRGRALGGGSFALRNPRGRELLLHLREVRSDELAIHHLPISLARVPLEPDLRSGI